MLSCFYSPLARGVARSDGVLWIPAFPQGILSGFAIHLIARGDSHKKALRSSVFSAVQICQAALSTTHVAFSINVIGKLAPLLIS